MKRGAPDAARPLPLSRDPPWEGADLRLAPGALSRPRRGSIINGGRSLSLPLGRRRGDAANLRTFSEGPRGEPPPGEGASRTKPACAAEAGVNVESRNSGVLLRASYYRRGDCFFTAQHRARKARAGRGASDGRRSCPGRIRAAAASRGIKNPESERVAPPTWPGGEGREELAPLMKRSGSAKKARAAQTAERARGRTKVRAQTGGGRREPLRRAAGGAGGNNSPLRRCDSPPSPTQSAFQRPRGKSGKKRAEAFPPRLFSTRPAGRSPP